jgi:hypothetical protein
MRVPNPQTTTNALRRLIGAFAFAGMSSMVFATDLEVEEALGESDKNRVLVPYAFYNKSTDAALGLAWAATGYVQPQMSFVVNGFYSANGSSNLFMQAANAQIPFLPRLFANAWMFVADWGEIDSYQNGNPDFPDEIAGSNGSDEDNFIQAEGKDNYYRLEFEYLLPIGDGRGDPVHTFRTRNGILLDGYEAGGREWNPFASGRTKIELHPFYRHQELEDEFDNEYDLETLGLTLGLVYDNTDWPRNPSRGSRTRFAVSRDWGMLDDSAPEWTALEFEYSKYFNLGPSKRSRQRVLAANFWTSDVPTWNRSHLDDQGTEVLHRPPLFAGSTLGGLKRQRGFAGDRFHDRAALNYTLEYRVMPLWSPFPKIPLVNRLNIPWWQWVVFMEAGRVADEWDIGELHKDMKFTFGGGVRISVEGLIIRVDLAGSEEGGEVQMFIGHAFQ